MKLVVQPRKCLTWAHFDLPHGFAFLTSFCYLIKDIRILGILFGSSSFSSSFLQEALDEDV